MNPDGYAGDGAPTDGSPWLLAPASSPKVGRGGYWSSIESYCRSAFRGYRTPENGCSGLGFRLVRTVR